MLERGYCYKLNIKSRQTMIKEYNRAAQAKSGLPPASMCDVQMSTGGSGGGDPVR